MRKFSVNWLFVEIHPIWQFPRKISGNCPFSENYITRKLGEIYVTQWQFRLRRSSELYCIDKFVGKKLFYFAAKLFYCFLQYRWKFFVNLSYLDQNVHKFNPPFIPTYPHQVYFVLFSIPYPFICDWRVYFKFFKIFSTPWLLFFRDRLKI